MKTLEKFFGKKEEKELIHYNFEELEGLEESAVEMVKRMKAKIDHGDYDILISDDASGRIPTLMLRKIINERNKVLHPEQSVKEREIKTVFISGGISPANNEVLQKAFEDLKPEVKKAALLVTEYMSTGESIARIAGLLEKAELSFDIASLTARGNFYDYLRAFPDVVGNHNLFIGDDTAHYPGKIWARSDLSGVKKVIKEVHPVIFFDRETGQEKINKVREDINTLANQALKKVWG